MADQYVVEIVRDRPEEEQAGDEREAQLEPRRDEAAGAGLSGIGGGFADRRGGDSHASPPSRRSRFISDTALHILRRSAAMSGRLVVGVSLEIGRGVVRENVGTVV